MQPSCDLCGRPGARFKAKVAGTEATVCEHCAALGTVTEEIQEAPKPSEARHVEKQKREIVTKTEEVLEDVGRIVKEKREDLKLTQEDLGKKISEHESMIKRIEHGYIPDLHIAKKLEHVLHAKLTELANPNEQEYVQNKGGAALTLGDIMIVRKKEPK